MNCTLNNLPYEFDLHTEILLALTQNNSLAKIVLDLNRKHIFHTGSIVHCPLFRVSQWYALYVLLPSSLSYKTHLIPTLKRSSCCLVAVFAESLEARCQVENEDVVGAAPTGDAPTTSECHCFHRKYSIHVFVPKCDRCISSLLWRVSGHYISNIHNPYILIIHCCIPDSQFI